MNFENINYDITSLIDIDKANKKEVLIQAFTSQKKEKIKKIKNYKFFIS